MLWSKVTISTNNEDHIGIAPDVISASRSTDIPAFYSEWFINRLRAGYVRWINPFNKKPTYISFEKTKFIVFWSKDPKPLIKYLDEVHQRGIDFYFQFTLNDYQKEGFEPNERSLCKRVETFIEIADRFGEDRIIWRYDPLLMTRQLGIQELCERIHKVGEMLFRHTKKLVYSYADIAIYKKVANTLKRQKIEYQEFDDDTVKQAAEIIGGLAKSWKIQVATCSEPFDLHTYGILHNKCIDDELILRLTNYDANLCQLFGWSAVSQHDLFDEPVRAKYMKDPGQREDCGCVVSKDIGQYNTCPHLCAYCYANTSEKVVRQNLERYNRKGESIAGED